MGHGTSSLLVPTSGSSTQAELVGITPGSGFQDLRVRGLGIGTDAPGVSGAVAQVVSANSASGYGYSLNQNQNGQGGLLAQVNAGSNIAIAAIQGGGVQGYAAVFWSTANLGAGGATTTRNVIAILDLTPLATGTGAGIGFYGKLSGASTGDMGNIRSVRENATDGQSQTRMIFATCNFAYASPASPVDALAITSNLDVQIGAGKVLGWSSTAISPTSTADTSISRTAAATLAVGNGTNGNATGTVVASLHQDASTNLRNVSTTIAQAATDGFIFAPVCLTGAPSGVPTLGNGALVVGGDAHLYCRMGGAWVKVDSTAAATPTLAQVITAGNSTPGSGGTTTPLLINTGDIIKFNNISGTTTANCIAWGTSAYVFSDSSGNLVLQAATSQSLKLITATGTGAGNAAFGAGNSPAATPGTVFAWLKCLGPAGDTVYIPCWK